MCLVPNPFACVPARTLQAVSRVGTHREVRFASGPNTRSSGRVDRHAVGRRERPTIDQAFQATSRRVVHVPGSSRSPFRQQPRRANDSPGRDHPKKQSREPERTRRRLPSRADECLSHAQATRPRPHSHRYRRACRVSNHRKTALTTDRHFRWLKCYEKRAALQRLPRNRCAGRFM